MANNILKLAALLGIIFVVWLALPLMFRNRATTVEPLSSGRLREFYVEAFQWGFYPDTLEVNKGDRVRITGTSRDVPHSLDLREFNVDLKMVAGENNTVEFVADKAGTFVYDCDVYCGAGHGSMAGRLVVNE